MKEIDLLPNALMLARHKHFGRAANALNISQPTLSRRIQQLESMIGERLFERDSGEIVPTQAGHILLKHARFMLASSKAMHEEIQRHRGLLEGSLRIGSGAYPSSALLAQVVGPYSERYPGIEIEINVDDWSKIPNQLIKQNFDFVLMESSHLDVSKNFDLIRLNRHQAFFYCRRGHPLLEKSDLVISDLSHYALIRTTLPKRLTDFFDKWASPGSEPDSVCGMKRNIICNDLGTMTSTVFNSNAIGIGTYGSLASPLETGDLVVLPFIMPEFTTFYDIVKIKGLALSPAARIFIDTLIETDELQFARESDLLKGLKPVIVD